MVPAIALVLAVGLFRFLAEPTEEKSDSNPAIRLNPASETLSVPAPVPVDPVADAEPVPENSAPEPAKLSVVQPVIAKQAAAPEPPVENKVDERPGKSAQVASPAQVSSKSPVWLLLPLRGGKRRCRIRSFWLCLLL